MRRIGILIALLAAALLGTGMPASASTIAGSTGVFADVDDFTFDSMTADYTLTRDDEGVSRLAVVEQIVAVFPDADQNRGIRRLLPESYNGQPLRPDIVSVTDENGNERPMEVESEDGFTAIVSRASDYLHGPQTYVITYSLENVTWNFPDTGLEFYWDVNGVDWAQTFGSVTARLHLAPDLAASLGGRTACYQGYLDSRDPCASITQTQDADGDTVITAEASAVAPHQTLTMAVGFAPETFALFDSSYLATPLGWLQAIGGLALAGAGGFALRARRRGLADEPGRPTIIAEYTPPPNVDALQSAVLLGKTTKAIPAEVLEQAVVGSIRIVEGASTWRSKVKLVAELIDPARADGDGRMLLDGLFPKGVPGEQYEFGKQDTRFSKVAQQILTAAETDLKTRGLRRIVPGATRWAPIIVGAIGLAVVIVLGFGAIGASVNPVVPLMMMGAGAAIMIAIIAMCARKPLTTLGAEARDHLRGLEEFIAWAEADRIRMLQTPEGAERVAVDVDDPRQKLQLYEKLLPYAVVFGQEKQWSKELAVLYTAIGASGPYWYYGVGAFDASSFSSGIGSLSSAAMSSSSTSGGSGGGGSAGGGGGGGGGGGV